MAEKDKAADKAPQKPDKKSGPEAIDAPFDDIIDAILGADPEAVRDKRGQMHRRQKRT